MRVLRNGDDEIIVREFPADPLVRIPKTLSIKNYLETYAAFDIETSNIEIAGEINAIMYLWQFCIGNEQHRDVYVGRTWKDFRVFMNQLKIMYSLAPDKRLVVWVHNLPFEFQFIRSVLEITKMFAVKKRVPVVTTFDNVFEFRCSYRLSNMSLAKFAESENAEHQKQKDFDYLITRYPDTEISDSDLYYGVCDVLSLHESVAGIMRSSNDTLSSMPFTSTGYTRREARDHVQENPANRWDLLDRQLSPHQYKICKSATRGGNTHTNVLYAGEIIKGVEGDDISSSYPCEMAAGDNYPRGKFVEEHSKKIIPDACNLLFVRLWNVDLKPGVYFPYISYAKCERLSKDDMTKARFDNGRVLRAPVLTMCCTEIDYEIIESQYTFTPEILEQYVSDRGYLCQEYRDYVTELYKAKCELKSKDPYFYGKFKNRINALFGMMLTDITREEITYQNDDWDSQLPSVAKALMDYYKNYRSFLSYQDGLYVTAGARKKLQRGLDLVGIDAIYCDTDSIKYRRDHRADFELLNAEVRARNAKAGVKPVTVNGETFELGVWEHDCSYDAFIAHGAKKYAYKYSKDACNGKHKGELGITVAGLSKSLGMKYLEEHGGLEAFKVGAFWDETRSGRLKAKYNDTVQLVSIEHNGHSIELTSNVALVPTTYKLGYTDDYAELVKRKDLRKVYNDTMQLTDLIY